jgi:hypothetical protein
MSTEGAAHVFLLALWPVASLVLYGRKIRQYKHTYGLEYQVAQAAN